MKKFQQISKICILAYCIIAAVVLVLLYTNQKITRTVQSTSGTAYEQKVDSVAFGFQLTQTFTPQYENLDTLRIYVDTSACAKEVGVLQMSVVDEHSDNIFHSQIPVSELPQYGWVDIPVHIRLSCNQTYTIVLESIDCIDFGPKISFYDAKLAATKEQQGHNMVYAEMEVANSALRIAFVYAVSIEIYEYLVYYIFGLVIISILFGNINSETEKLNPIT